MVPTHVPLTMAGKAALRSGQVGIRFLIFPARMLRSWGLPRLAITSPMPNRPTTTGTKSMPSAMSGIPNVSRGLPEFTSIPTRPTSTPMRTMAMALNGEP